MKTNEAEDQLRSFIAKADAALELDEREKSAAARAALQTLADELMLVTSRVLMKIDILESPSIAKLITELEARKTAMHQRCSRLN